MNFKQEIKFFFLLFLILFFLWIIFSGYLKPFFIFCGVFSSMFTSFVFKQLVNAESAFIQILNNASKLSFYRLLINYIPWLVYQIILSSIYVTRKVLQSKLKLEPVDIFIKECKEHIDESITLFANSVTITPGTLVIDVVKKKRQTYLFTVCLIDKSLRSSILKIENKVLKVLYESDDCFK
ncbi:Na+/H+ antiporter subunit E [Wolbachia endosymbiont of Dipetalonema caudispina]|uniref:Na+/H+ antiporter subunit E n=1 Tax=Wolbachia endosymbiont of Dipetalonema caudispina TaxID=1812112 RepID=UPI00158F3D24|nr:Na+/H+ antiporter subunit E [Wolbachia endosymbiont of Dipetalonema caudispina]QKX00771.1 Na+/H+ antiporter subunit E [Wolbachia endosymbiont of Dipetalonema caudispina]